MLRDNPWIHFSSGIDKEFEQALEEGKAIPDTLQRQLEQITKMEDDNPLKDSMALEFYRSIQELPTLKDYPYTEPNTFDEIVHEMGNIPLLPPANEKDLYERIYGAWLGRCAGCLLGQPIEGWERDRILGLLKDTGNYPLQHYISSDIAPEIHERYKMRELHGPYNAAKVGWINNVECMPEDDDTNYMVIALKLMENRGLNFTPDDVAENWLNNLPALHVCTAERVAYRNFLYCVYPPESAFYANPFREWIGAQIRGDLFGYVAPGNPLKACHMAFNDACISHIKNGIYGEMWVAAMLSAATVTDDFEIVLRTGLACIPQKSRLRAALDEVIQWYQEDISAEEATQRIHRKYDEHNRHHWCHTISNAMIVLTSLLFGKLDFTKSMGIVICAGFDTDCNAATVGSILGMLIRASCLPNSWTKPLNDGLISGVDGMGRVKISEMAKRTVALAQQFLSENL